MRVMFGALGALLAGCVSTEPSFESYYPSDPDVVLSEEELDARLIMHLKKSPFGLEEYTAVSGRLLGVLPALFADLSQQMERCGTDSIENYLAFFWEDADRIVIKLQARALPSRPVVFDDGTKTAAGYFGYNNAPAAGCPLRYVFSKSDGSMTVINAYDDPPAE